jgi:hypothetical protein
MNDERIDQVISELKAAADDAAETFGALSTEQLNWKPSEAGWSIAQCLDHLIRSNVEFDAEWEKLLNGTRRNSFFETWSPLTGFFGRFLINSLAKDSRKTKAPSKSIVPPSDVEPGIVGRFVQNVESTNSKIAGCRNVDLQRTVLTSPFLRLITYRLDDAFQILVEHTKRHIRQAKRVMQADGFPM